MHSERPTAGPEGRAASQATWAEEKVSLEPALSARCLVGLPEERLVCSPLDSATQQNHNRAHCVSFWGRGGEGGLAPRRAQKLGCQHPTPTSASETKASGHSPKPAHLPVSLTPDFPLGHLSKPPLLALLTRAP